MVNPAGPGRDPALGGRDIMAETYPSGWTVEPSPPAEAPPAGSEGDDAEFERLLEELALLGRLPDELLRPTQQRLGRASVPDVDLTPAVAPEMGMLAAPSGSWSHDVLWSWRSPTTVSAVAMRRINDGAGPTLVVGDTAGQVSRVVRNKSGEITTTQIDTKGACVAGIALGRLGPTPGLDMAVGDAPGKVSVLLGCEQVFLRHSVGCRPLIIAGDSAGTITAFDLHATVAWRCRLREVAPGGADSGQPQSSDMGVDSAPEPEPCSIIRCILPVSIVDEEGTRGDYVLACDGTPNIAFLGGSGQCVLSVGLPVQASVMAMGFFWTGPRDPSRKSKKKRRSRGPIEMRNPATPVHNSGTPSAGSSAHSGPLDTPKQIAVGCLDGFVYLVTTAPSPFKNHVTGESLLGAFSVVRFVHVDFPVTHVAECRPAGQLDPDEPSLLLVAGHFAHVEVFSKGLLFHRIKLDAWVWQISVADDDSAVALSLLDNSVQVVGLRRLGRGEPDDE
nr:hypothetical protein HK105_001789 [Polyrhizophydium stewartii]